MFTVNGSVLTVGPDNILPIDTTYDFKRFAHKFLLQNSKLEEENFVVKDSSPYNNYLAYNEISSSLEQNQNIETSKPAFYFNGQDSYISCSCNNIISLNGPFTISFWVNSNISSLQNNNPRCIFHLGNSQTGYSIFFSFSQDGTTGSVNPSVFIYNNGILEKFIENTTTSIADLNWHHIEISRDIDNKCYLFIDGDLVSQSTNTISFGNNYDDSLVIGSFDNSSGFFNGYLSDFYILDGIIEHTSKFEPNHNKHLLPLDTENRHSGLVTHVQVNEKVKKYDLLYYDPQHRSYMIADSKDINKLPAQGIAIEDGERGNTIKMLTYGTLCVNASDFADENQEYNSIIPISENEADSFIISSSAGDASNLITKNNKLNPTKYWDPLNYQNHRHHWFKIKLNKPRVLKFYSIKSTHNYTPNDIVNCGVKNWKLKGSLDNKNWVLLDFQNNQIFNTHETKLYSLPNNETEYLYYEFFDMDHNYVSEIHLYDSNKIDLIPTFGKLYFTITADSNDTDCEIYKISDDDENTYWSPANNLLTGIITCDFGQVYDFDYFDFVTVNKFSITCNNSDIGKQIYIPSIFKLFGSNNNEDWDELYHFDHGSSTIPWATYGDKAIFDLTEDTHYRYYKLQIYSCTPYLNGDLPEGLKLVNFELLNNDVNIIPINKNDKRRIVKSYSNIITVSDNNTTYSLETAPGNLFNYNEVVANNENNFYSRWEIQKTNYPYYLNIDFGENNSKKVAKYSIRALSSNYVKITNPEKLAPKSWIFQGSNDSSTWTNIQTISNQQFTPGQTLIYSVPTPNDYRYYRLNITSTVANGTLLSFSELHLYDESGNNLISDNGYGPYFYDGVIDYFNFEMAKYSIEGPDGKTANSSVTNVLSNFYSFNMLNETDYQYCTQDGQLAPTITIMFPDSNTFSMWNNLVDGYVIRSGINVTNPKSYRYPSSWNIEGLRKYWDPLDSKTKITFDNPNQRKYFELSSEQVGLRGFRMTVTNTTGSTEVAPPNYLHLMEFYPTYKGNKLNLPTFNRVNLSSNDFKVLNNSVCYSTNDISAKNSWECCWSSSDLPYFGHECLNYSNDDYWKISSTTANIQYDNRSSIYINTKASKKIIAYGIYLYPKSLCDPLQNTPIISWKLYGSNDYVNWDLLHEVNPLLEEDVLNSWPIVYRLNTSKSYKFFKLDDIEYGCFGGLDFYTNTNIINSKKLTISSTNKGQIANSEKLIVNNQLENYYIQDLGYTGITFKSAIDEYSVVYFDFNKQLHLKNPNVGDYFVNNSSIGKIGHSIIDGPLVTLLCDELHILPNQVLTTAADRCRGLRIIVKNDCIIDGSISMDGKGSFYSPLWTEDFPIIDEKGNILGYIPRYGAPGAIDAPTINTDRLSGIWYSTSHTNAYLQYGKSGKPGTDGVGRQTGGGGSGAVITGNQFYSTRGGNGGFGTCFGGGSGGGSYYGWGANVWANGMPAINNCGIGGASYSSLATYYNINGTSAGTTANTYPGVPGAGIPTGIQYAGANQSESSSTGCGGLIILIVYGNLWLNLGSSITANGCALNEYKTGATSIIGGAGSGGGSINIFYGGLFINNGLISANGGISTNLVNGGKGGDGCITIDKLN